MARETGGGSRGCDFDSPLGCGLQFVSLRLTSSSPPCFSGFLRFAILRSDAQYPQHLEPMVSVAIAHETHYSTNPLCMPL
jgi:hypothetical protein